MKLTEQQLAYFDTFGFLKFPGLLAEEVERISEAFGETWRSVGGGHDGRPHDHERRSALVPFIDRTEYLSALLDDPRIEGIAASLLGDDFNYSGSDGNYYVGDTKWHSDGYVGRKYLSVKMAFYLDRLPVTLDACGSYRAATSTVTSSATTCRRCWSGPRTTGTRTRGAFAVPTCPQPRWRRCPATC